ncbi:MAG: HAMP domain-containing histidine kinase [Burkholderiaceae bacterium]|nr:HAMP domain-containing histidine kinase [Burkholderiaceae bacterium]
MNARRPSLRRQLAWTLTALALFVAIMQAAFVYVTGERAEEAMIDNVATEQLRLSIAQYRRDPALAQPNTPDMRLYVAIEGGDASSLPTFLRDLPRAAGNHEVFPEAALEYHVAVDRDGDRWFYLVYDVEAHERRQRNVMAVLAVSVLGIALVVLAASDRIARRLTGDLERLSNAVGEDGPAVPASETAQDGTSRGALRDLARHDESSRLADALDRYRRRLAEALLRERAFSAAASHELRTPLMRASSTVELLRQGSLDRRQREQVDRIDASLTEIAMLTAGLLRVARGTARDVREPIELARLVGDVVAHLGHEAAARDIDIATHVPADAHARGDRDALWIVLANLLRNAIRHSGGSRIDIEWQSGRLTVRDDGRGFDYPGQSRSASGAGDTLAAHDDSLGLGLSIVERICEAAGWPLTIASHPAGGTRIDIGLSAAGS